MQERLAASSGSSEVLRQLQSNNKQLKEDLGACTPVSISVSVSISGSGSGGVAVSCACFVCSQVSSVAAAAAQSAAGSRDGGDHSQLKQELSAKEHTPCKRYKYKR